MIRGRLVLWADSPLEAQVIMSFLEAADYVVDNLASPGYISHEKATFDAAVVVLDRWDSNLAQVMQQVRSLTGNRDLAIIAIASKYPEVEEEGMRILLRPVRLFELVQTVQEVIRLHLRDPLPSYRLD